MKTPVSRRLHAMPVASLALAAAVLLAACGGGDTWPDGPQADSSSVATARSGMNAVVSATDDTHSSLLRSATPLSTVAVHQVIAATAGAGVPAIGPIYDVQTYRLTYTTIDGNQQPIIASGLLAVPKKGPGASSPVISYQHATIFRDAQAPSNNPTATEPAVVMAAMGYVVVAADYVGYGVSKGAPHPYLMAAPMAAAVVDLLYAARDHAGRSGLVLNGQLFLVGYSQGGHATLAAQRALQARGGDIAGAVLGSAPGGGPLDVGATLDELLRRVRDENVLLSLLVDPRLLQNLGADLRRQVRDDADVVFQTRFIDNFLANDRGAIERDSDVHDWRPAMPVRMFHGRDDQTVPFVASQRAQQAMLARAAPDVQLAECTALPAGHLECVPQYWQHMLSQMARVVRDL
ncbi:MAG: alpha/beta fold hydrolase [Chitinophagaceae bacterium]|nr:alpha/beta fold hydrolase [Rubrivivax sp.]